MANRTKVQISQEAFDSLVKENMDDFDMPLEEALEDAINTFKLQGVDLRGNSSFMTLVMVEYCTLSTSFQEIVLA